MLRCAGLLLLSTLAFAADLPRGQIVDAVPCAADATQRYALYLPSGYTPARRWSVLLAFDAGGRGRMPVERFEAASEKYGYIVAGSLNSRNGPLGVSIEAANAMWKDVSTRFSVDKTRLYTTGQSGGARVAMYLAMHREVFHDRPAGVIASSAGFPGPDAPEALSFPVFATAGTEDFNHLEMRQFDRTLTSLHRLAIFEGGHQWLPEPLAMQAIEWMELDAMRSGLTQKNAAVVDAVFAGRLAQARAETEPAAHYLAISHLAFDFDGLKNPKDIKDLEAEAARLRKDPAVQAQFDKDDQIDQAEDRLSGTLFQLASQLRSPSRRAKSLAVLKTEVATLASEASAPADSSGRQMARRVLRGFMASTRAVTDEDFQLMLENLRQSIGRF